jgi:peptidoglycan/xylan/chitin deacetylase (PgdA/CDA1 family)
MTIAPLPMDVDRPPKYNLDPVEPGIFIISLDFELFWGVRDHRSLADYGANILGVRKSIPAILEMFRRHDIHATWATVGLLFFDKKADMIAHCPQLKPGYARESLSPYADVAAVGPDEATDSYHYGKSLLDLIRSCPGQEIATHTFSHYYCCEPGQDVAAFQADIEAAVRTAKAHGVELRSIVFPRNQTAAEYLKVCQEFGISCYRGNENAWFYAKGTRQGETLAVRAGRLLDTYFNISGHNTYPLSYPDGLVNLPASRFLRPWERRLSALNEFKYRRITSGIKEAAQNGKVYHLWWHPHNFGVNLDKNIASLERILGFYARMQKDHAMRSMSMGEAAALALKCTLRQKLPS